MPRRASRLTLVSLTILIAPACRGGDGTPSRARSSAPVAPAAVLTVEDPVARVEIAPVPEADVVSIEITSIDNPRSQAFVVTSLVEVPGKDGRRDLRAIGTLGPYPPDRVGTFTLVIPHVLRTLFSREEAAIVVRLKPISADRPLEAPLRVVLGVSVGSSIGASTLSQPRGG